MCIGWGTPTLVDSYPSTPKQRAPKQQTLQLGGQRPRRSEIRRPLHRRAKPSLPPLLARRGVLEAVSPQQFVAHTSRRSWRTAQNRRAYGYSWHLPW